MRQFLPETCNYRGLYICQGDMSEDGYRAVKRCFNQNEEAIEHFGEFQIGAEGHPDADDLEAPKTFARQALEQDAAVLKEPG